MRSASMWPRLAPCPSITFASPLPGAPREAPLPFPAASLTRKALDTALIAEAIAAGVRLERGRSVQALVRTTSNVWQATLDDGTTHEAPTAFLATGKHDLRGYARPRILTDGSPSKCISGWLPPRPLSWRAPLS